MESSSTAYKRWGEGGEERKIHKGISIKDSFFKLKYPYRHYADMGAKSFSIRTELSASSRVLVQCRCLGLIPKLLNQKNLWW